MKIGILGYGEIGKAIQKLDKQRYRYYNKGILA